MRRFVILRDLKVDAPECKENETYDDSVMTVHYVPLEKETSISVEKVETDSPRSTSPVLYDDTDYYAHESTILTNEP